MAATTKKTNLSFWERLQFRNWRIVVKMIFVMLVLALIPLLIAIVTLTQRSSTLLTEQTGTNLSRLSFSTAQRIEQFLVDNHNFARMLALDPSTVAFVNEKDKSARDKLQPPVVQLTQNLLKASNGAIDLVGYYNTEGIVLWHTTATIIGQNYSTRDFVAQALQGNQFTSSILVGLTTGTPGINASVPVKDTDGRIIGAIAIRIRPEFVTNILESTAKAEGENISETERAAFDILMMDKFLVVVGTENPVPTDLAKKVLTGDLSGDGLLYRSIGTITDEAMLKEIKTNRTYGGSCPDKATTCDASVRSANLPKSMPSLANLRSTLTDSFQKSTSGSTRYCRPNNLDALPGADPNDCSNGTWHVVGYAPLKDPFRKEQNLFVMVVDLPENIFLQGIDEARQQGTVLAVGIAAVAAILALIVARTLASPIGKLAEAAHNVETDQPFEPKDIASVTSQGDELGNLARVFSAMVTALRARVSELRTINEIGNNIFSSIELDETLKYIVNSIGEVIKFDAAEVCLFDQNKNNMALHLAMVKGKLEDSAGKTYAPDQSYIGLLVKNKAVLTVRDITTFPEAQADPSRVWNKISPRSYLGVPLRTKDKVIGTIEMVSAQPDAFSVDNARLLESVSVQASVAVQNAQEVKQRERALIQQIQELRIEIDEAKKARQVAEITETEYFQNLKQKIKDLRNKPEKA